MPSLGRAFPSRSYLGKTQPLEKRTFDSQGSVSYTHLDVYKRQVPGLTHRRIAGLMGISTNQVHRVSLGRMKAANENEGEAESAVPLASPFASGEE